LEFIGPLTTLHVRPNPNDIPSSIEENTMKYRLQSLAILIFFVSTVYSQQTDSMKAQAADTTKIVPPPVAVPEATPAQGKVYYGGYVGATFGDYSSIEVSPMVGYHVSPVVSAGVRFNYEYISSEAYGQDFNASNYGGSVFSIARVHPNIFLQAEFQYMSYEWPTSLTTTTREWVPFLYLGGGAVKQLSGNVSLVATVLVDVLQDDNSPYKDWEPMISIGVIAGF
jgi:hypothetical protein